jgi:hypothetical protein
MNDPFVLRGRTPEEARRNAISHIYSSYDLLKLGDCSDDAEAALEPLIKDTLGPILVSAFQDHYVAEMPRRVLVAVGIKCK